MYKYLQYLPEYLQEVKDFQAIGSGTDPQTEALLANAQQVYENQFLTTADLSTVKRWEKIYNTVPPPGFSLQARRLKIILKQSEKVPYTYNMLSDYLSRLFFHADVAVDYGGYKVSVRIQMTDDTQVDNLYSTLRQMIPANMLISTTLHTDIQTKFYVTANMTDCSVEQLNGGFFTMLPSGKAAFGGTLTACSVENMNDRFETQLPGTITPGGSITDYTKEAIS